VTNDDYDEDRDPLLVRPFILRDSGTPAKSSADDPSTQTWPAAAAPENRSPQAPDDADGADDPTAVVTLPPERVRGGSHRSGNRRRLLVVLAAAAAVLLGATAAGYAVLRPGIRPSVTAAQPGEPLPAVTGPPTSAPAVPVTSGPPSSETTPQRSTGAATTSASASASASVRPTTTVPTTVATTSTPTAGGKTSVSPTPILGIAPDPVAARTGVVRGQNGLCLDLNGGVPFDNNHVQAFVCNSSVAQTWTLAADGTLRVQDMCALVVGDGTVHITGCDGRTPAQWRVSGQRLINAASDGCLTDPSGGRTSGTGVTVTPCTGSAGQRWSLP
jgi:Ricin-type beta-trefoil lectin domain